MTLESPIEYNIQDNSTTGQVDKKLRFIDPSNELAHANTVLLQTLMGAVCVTEQAFRMKHIGEVCKCSIFQS